MPTVTAHFTVDPLKPEGEQPRYDRRPPLPEGDYIRLTALGPMLGMGMERIYRLYRAGAFKSTIRRGPYNRSPIYILRSEAAALKEWYASTVPAPEAARLVGCDKKTIFRWFKNRSIEGGYDHLGHLRVSRKDLSRYAPQLVEVVD